MAATRATSVYDNKLAHDYQQAFDENSLMVNVTDYTLFKILGDVSGKTLLDVGCGSGRITRKLSNKGV